MSFAGKTQVEVVNLACKLKVVHITNVKYILHEYGVIAELSHYQSFVDNPS